jgi:hypothetical protein
MEVASVPEPASYDDIREEQFWKTVTRLTWTFVVVGLTVAVLSSLTLLFGWLPYLLLSLLGVLAGIAIAVAVAGSPRGRVLTGLVLGGVTFPLLAAYFGGLAVSNFGAFSAYSTSFFPFLANAAGTLLAALWIGRIWHAGSQRPAEVTEGGAKAARGGSS